MNDKEKTEQQLRDCEALRSKPGGYLPKGLCKNKGKDCFTPGEWKIKCNLF